MELEISSGVQENEYNVLFIRKLELLLLLFQLFLGLGHLLLLTFDLIVTLLNGLMIRRTNVQLAERARYGIFIWLE